MLAFLAACVVCVFTVAPPAEPREALLAGVKQIAAPGSPGAVIALASPAEAVVVGKMDGSKKAAVVVASTWGRGRVVALGHSGYLDPATLDQGDTGRFLLNAVEWAGAVKVSASAGIRPPRVLTVDSLAHEWLNQHDGDARAAGAKWPDLSGVDVVVSARSSMPPDVRERVAKFVKDGGGLIIAQTGWGWQQINAGADMRTHEPSILLREAGIAWTDDFVAPQSPERFDATEAPGALLRFDRAMEALFPPAGQKPASATPDPQAGMTVAMGTRLLPPDDLVYRTRLDGLVRDRLSEVKISARLPLRANRPAERALVTYAVESMASLAPGEMAADPRSAEFPGPVRSDAPRITAERTISLSTPGWHSLGLYAAPGEVVRLTWPAGGAIKPGTARVQIGSHTDRLWHKDSWSRVPEITLSRPMGVTAGAGDEEMEIASPFGGLVYVCVEKPSKGEVSVRIEGAVEAPLFVLGKTDPAEWRSRLRTAPGPWAEFATSKVIVTVPSEHVRDIDDPRPVLELWDRVMDACADLAAMPRERARPERYVADVQISAGYMHAGYPIMTHLDAADDMVIAAKLASGNWGLFHEMGHNHQDAMWTFSGTGEVTCNLFSLYVYETVCGKPPRTGHNAVNDRSQRVEKMRTHLAAGAPFEKWKSDPFLALEMYMQLQEAFGWETYKKVFAEYRALPQNQRPRGEQQKRDQWMLRFSRAAGRNLGPFFQKWGVPTSEEARRAIADLPEWMPDEMK